MRLGSRHEPAESENQPYAKVQLRSVEGMRGKTMNVMTRLMVSITGHQVDASTRFQDVAGLSKIGLAICFASALAALQFGVAGWYLASSLDPTAQLISCIVMGLIGASVVLIIDRNFIYAADTSCHSNGQTAYFYLATRIFLILVISSLSSQFTLPLLLKSELEIHVQDLRDERYDLSKDRYSNKYELSEKVRDERELSQKIAKIKATIATPPPELIRQKLAYEQCFREYKKKINGSIGPDVDDEEVANLYSREKIRCEQFEIAYKEGYKIFVAPKLAELAMNEASYRQLESDVQQAKKAFKSDLQKADLNNAQFLNSSSADVLWSLIRHNPGARMKYLMITLVQLILELMPLLLKSLLGRSPLGLAIALRQQHLNEEFERKQHLYALGKVRESLELTEVTHRNSELGLKSKIALQHLENELRDIKGSSWLKSGRLHKESLTTSIEMTERSIDGVKKQGIDGASHQNNKNFPANLYVVT